MPTPLPEVTVRSATAADDVAVADLVVRSYVAGGHVGPDDDYVQVLRATARRREHADVLVATVQADGAWDHRGGAHAEGHPAGTVTVVRGGTEYSEFGETGDLEIRMLAVDPEHAGQGIGRQLLTVVLDRARTENAAGVSLYTLDSMTAARRLYLAAGFEAVPERDHRVSPAVLLRAFRLDLS